MVQHVDPEILALLALGEQPEDVTSADERAHLVGCDACRGEIAALSDVATTGRSVTAEDRVTRPDPSVWAAIHAELGLSDAVRDVDPVPVSEAVAPSAVAPVADLDAHRRRRQFSGAWLAAAASVALVAGVTGGVLWGGRDDAPAPTPAPTEITVASATLDPLPGWKGTTGTATVEESPDGTRQVVVTMEAPRSDAGYHEVWLIKDDLSGLVSLGVLDGTTGTFPVPDGLDLTSYSLVDVSEEHFDGDPTHSGDSIVRGPLSRA